MSFGVSKRLSTLIPADTTQVWGYTAHLEMVLILNPTKPDTGFNGLQHYQPFSIDTLGEGIREVFHVFLRFGSV